MRCTQVSPLHHLQSNLVRQWRSGVSVGLYAMHLTLHCWTGGALESCVTEQHFIKGPH